jgi:peptidoglycan/LPS O-acetylase OafA/YrhL
MKNAVAKTISGAGQRYHSLDIWRGVACLLVILHHSTIYSDYWISLTRGDTPSSSSVWSYLVSTTSVMWIGVPVFFVISGYCISVTVDAAVRNGTTGYTYFMRRIRRIYPPYLVFTAFMIVFAFALDRLGVGTLWSDEQCGIPGPHSLDSWQWLGNATLTETWRWHLVGPRPLFFNGVAWTLCYEEQFYAIMGLLLVAIRKRWFAGAVGMSLVVAAVASYGSRRAINMNGFFFDGYWVSFFAGVLVHATCKSGKTLHRILIQAALLALAAYCSSGRLWVYSVHASVKESAYVACLFALALIAFHPYDQRLTSCPMLQPLAYCGRMCYSLYLVHWPVSKAIGHGLYNAGIHGDGAAVLVALPLSIVASVCAATVFYRSVEMRFLNSSIPAESMTTAGSALARDGQHNERRQVANTNAPRHDVDGNRREPISAKED